MSPRKSVLVPLALAALLAVASSAMALTDPPASGSTTSKSTTATTSTSHSSSSAHKSSKPHVDINSATKEQLMTLPGIDDATAMKIIQGRPFKSKSDLLSKGLVDKTEYGKIESHIAAKQPAKTK